MKCPICSDAQLVMSDRQGIEIDYCPQCRGVWLDRGELDKVIERSATAPPIYQEATPRGERQHIEQERSQSYSKEGYGQKRKKSLLGDLFDF